jgi:rare lipoprotein A
MILSSRIVRATVVLLCSALGLIGCSTTPQPFRSPAPYDSAALILPPGVTYKVGRPYKIAGTWYYPAKDDGYVEEGMASWYGPNFHGKRTANGEIYNMNALTAAHRTLPLPSIVRVTNLENGRVLTLRVNDRGPFKSNRIIDISRRGAEILGFIESGITRVLVEIDARESLNIRNLALGRNPGPMPKIKSSPRTPVASASLPPPPAGEATAVPNAAPDTVQIPIHPKPVTTAPLKLAVESVPVDISGEELYVQAGAFSEEENALRLAHQLDDDFGDTFVMPVTVDGVQYFRVRLGPVESRDAADDLLAEVQSYGYDDARVIHN